MPTASERRLRKQAEGFADDLSGLLNKTVCHGVRISPILQPNTGFCWVGYGYTKSDLTIRKGVPLRVRAGKARAHLMVAQVMCLDDEGTHLTTSRAQHGLYLDEALKQMVLHYDYERGTRPSRSASAPPGRRTFRPLRRTLPAR